MAARNSRRSVKRTWRSLLVTVVALCVLLSVGSLFPGTSLPGWQDVFLATGLTPATSTVEGELEVHFIDVGNADCTLVRQGEHSLLIDAGERGDSDDILEYLSAHGVKKLDMAVATHPHADHMGGMADILNAIPVDCFLMSFMPEEKTPTSAVYLNMLEALDERAIPVEEAKPGATYTLGEAALQVLGPIDEAGDPNAMSVVTRLTFGQHAFLFTGDATDNEEEDILATGYPVRADVLKVAHHGSDTSNSYDFLRAVAPSYGFIPCGLNNSYGHPMQRVLDDLTALNVHLYRADVHGHTVFTSDGTSLSVTTEKE